MAIITAAAILAAVFGFSGEARAYPFGEEHRLDLNSADEFDFMDIYEMDIMAAERAVKFRSDEGPFEKEEALLKFIPRDAFLDIFETVEVGSLKSPRVNYYNGNSYSDFVWDVDHKNSSSSYSRYNLNFSEYANARISFGQDTLDNHLVAKEKFANFYFYTDSYLKKGYVIESSPAIKKVKINTPTDEEIQKRNFEALDGYFSQKVMVGRKKRKKIIGLYETNLEDYRKYLAVAKKRKKKGREEEEAEEEKKEEPPEEKENLVKDVKLELPRYLPKGGAATDEVEPAKKNQDFKLVSAILTVGDVMLPQGRNPLINLHRTNNSGLKYKKYFQNFSFTAIGSKVADRNEHRLGGALDFDLQENAKIGGRAEKIWDNDQNHQIDYVHLYGAGRTETASVYGEYQNVFNGAESIFAEVMSGFSDVNLTTRILSVKENYQGPSAVSPYTFDGQFSTFMRMNYNFSDIASFAASYQTSDLKRNNPDEDWGREIINKYRFLLYPTEKARIMMTYMDDRTPDDIMSNTFATSVRYLYRPRINLIGKFSLRDYDVDSPAGRTAVSSLEWQRRVKSNLKIIFNYTNVWDESKLGQPDEFNNIAKIAYFRNF